MLCFVSGKQNARVFYIYFFYTFETSDTFSVLRSCLKNNESYIEINVYTQDI